MVPRAVARVNPLALDVEEGLGYGIYAYSPVLLLSLDFRMECIAQTRTILAASAMVFAATSAPSIGAPPDRFNALEAKLSNALASYDRSTLDRLWDDQLVFVFPNGTISRKAERLKAQMPPVGPISPKLVATNDSVKVEYEDAHLAVVIVRSSWKFGDAPAEPFVATHVWIRRPETWRLISASVAEVRPPKPAQ